MGKKTFGEMELYPTTPWQLVRKSKYFQKKKSLRLLPPEGCFDGPPTR